LSARGVEQAEHAGRLLAAEGFTFDVCFTSYLQRAIETLGIVLDTMDLRSVAVKKTWCLNERHCGALQGLKRWEAVRKYGAKQILVWQWRFAIPPPALDANDARFPGRDPRYAALAGVELPRAESLRDTFARILPYWRHAIAPELRQGKRTLIVAHRNTLRAIVKHLDAVSDTGIARIRIPTGKPLVYELDDDMRPIRHYYLRAAPKCWTWAMEMLRGS
jgi:2,3-bisphosphoglycerate-dependent phosphoglycerate mutase